MEKDLLALGAIGIVFSGLAFAVVRGFASKKDNEIVAELQRSTPTLAKAVQEQFSDWQIIETSFSHWSYGGEFCRFLAIVFAIWAVLAFLYAEADWDSTSPRDGMIGVGASSFATTHYARAIALAAISAALSVLSSSLLNLRQFRISYRAQLEHQAE